MYVNSCKSLKHCPRLQGLDIDVCSPKFYEDDLLQDIKALPNFPNLRSLKIICNLGLPLTQRLSFAMRILEFTRLLVLDLASWKHFTCGIYLSCTDIWTVKSRDGVEDMLLALPRGLSALALSGDVYGPASNVLGRMLDRGHFLGGLEELAAEPCIHLDGFPVSETADSLRCALKMAGGKLKKLTICGFNDDNSRVLGLHDANPDLEFLRGLKTLNVIGEFDWGTLFRWLLKEKRFLPQLESCSCKLLDELDQESIRNAFQLMQSRHLQVFPLTTMYNNLEMPNLKELLMGLSQFWGPQTRPYLYMLDIMLYDDETAQLLASALECLIYAIVGG